MTLSEFYRGRRVLVTGHTGFKGSWLVRLLTRFGANVTGYAMLPPTSPNLFSIAQTDEGITSVTGDVRDRAHLAAVFAGAQPEVVFHLAAQPIVRDSYRAPVYTYETNVMGTVNLLDCARESDSVRSIVNITTDKVYQNLERSQGYVETDVLNGFDPYSNSKSCSELVTSSFQNAFFSDGRVAISTARAGNVIGGGDFARDRILPDCVRAAEKGEPIVVRNPNSVRPYQHVLEPLFAYLTIAMRQHETHALAGAYNVGPAEKDVATTGELATIFCSAWGDGASWVARPDGGPHEANLLRLDCKKLYDTFGLAPKWDVKTAVEKTVEWHKAHLAGEDVRAVMDKEIEAYEQA